MWRFSGMSSSFNGTVFKTHNFTFYFCITSHFATLNRDYKPSQQNTSKEIVAALTENLHLTDIGHDFVRAGNSMID